MRTRTLVLVGASILLASLFTWLGFWQIGRLHEKQKYNETVASRRFLPAIPFDSIPADTVTSRFRRVKLSGTYDYQNQVVWTLRGRDGSPGVNILTPLRRQGKDTAVLVNRGWVYSPDATRVDLEPWNEADSLTGDAYILPLRGNSGAENTPIRNRSFRSLDLEELRKVFPYPIAPVFAVLSTAPLDSVADPPRVTLIPLDEGSHRSYAFQWFSFAAISIIGAVIFTRKT